MAATDRSNLILGTGIVIAALMGFALGVVVTLWSFVSWSPPSVPTTKMEAPKTEPHLDTPITGTAGPQPAQASPAQASPAQASLVPNPPPAVPPPAVPPPAVPPPVAPEAAPTMPAAAASAAKEPPKATAPLADRAHFVVLAGSFLNEAIAASVAQRLSSHGYRAETVIRPDNNGRMWNVVRLSENFATRGEAEEISIALKKSGETDTLVVKAAAEAQK